MSELKDFETLWAIRGHAAAIKKAIPINGVSDSKLKILKETIDRMSELIDECYKIRGLE